MDSLRKIKIVQLSKGVFPRPPVFNINTKFVKVTHNKYGNFKDHDFEIVAHQDENNNPAVVGGFSHIIDDNAETSLLPFNPRIASNMPLTEKITKWLRDIPFRQTENHEWVPDCFPATIAYNSAEDASSDAAYDLEDEDSVEALQDQRTTRYIIRLYVNDPEPVAFGGQTVCMPMERGLFCTNP